MLSESQVQKIQEKSANENDSLSLMFGALSDPGRMQVFKILLEHNDICVSDMANILKVSVPAASRQLTILEFAGLIKKIRKGQSTCFKILWDSEKTRMLIQILKKGETR